MASVPPLLAPWLERRTSPEQPLALTVGTMNFGTRTPAAEAERIVSRALERGLRFFDTANLYGNGEAERILGRALRGRRAEVGLASKVGLARVGGKPEGLAAPQVERAVEALLQRLGTEYVDLLYLHAPDAQVPPEETLGALHRLWQAGKVRHWGVSNFAAWRIYELNLLSDSLGLPRPAVSQVLYNLLVRQLEVEYFDFTSRHPLHTTLYNPLAGGLLSGRYTPGAPVPTGSRFESNRLYQRRYFSERLLALTDQFSAVAQEAGLSLLELAYAWLSSRPGVDSLVLGPASVEHLDAAVEACARRLPEDVLERIESVYQAWLGTDARYAR
jgi:aryl-alcohol dehydrogenase-like predicted oxidoreductase